MQLKTQIDKGGALRRLYLFGLVKLILLYIPEICHLTETSV